MTLIVGLGNPGREYASTRHNVGFFVIDRLIESGKFSSLGGEVKFFGELFESGSLLLLKPTTFMNASGKAVLAVSNFYKPDNIIVIHDDIDLPLGALRFKSGGSSGGHNGIKSIDSAIGADYHRIRIGVGRPNSVTTSHVLSEFSSGEMEILEPALKNAQNAALEIANGLSDSEANAKYKIDPNKIKGAL